MADSPNSSQLVNLLNAGNYPRLDALSAHSPNVAGAGTNYSVRKQAPIGATPEKVQQGNAANFMDDANQTGFTVYESANSLSTTGISKDEGTNNTKFTDKAQNTYDTLARDVKLNQYKSKLVHKYLATVATSNYATIKSATVGINLMYSA
jgi:hypothetical protein